MKALSNVHWKEGVLIGGCFLAALFMFLKAAFGVPYNYSEKKAQNYTRACIPQDTTKISTSTSAAENGTALTENTNYYAVATVDTHISCSSTASGNDATTNDFLLPKNTVFPFSTGPAGDCIYFSTILASGTGSVFLFECK